jgi:regulator of nucleoside diphosphate kinase
MMAAAIAATQLAPQKNYHLCWSDERIQCRPVRHTRDAHEVFFSAPGHVLLNGLPLHQWRLLTTKVADFCRTHDIALDLESGRRRDADARPAPRRRITEFDVLRLRGLADTAQAMGIDSHMHVDRLRLLLQSADVVEPWRMPPDVVTMNSEVQVRNEEADIETRLALVFPADARTSDLDTLKLSILTDTGLSLLGRKAGDTVEGRLKITGLPYQPEAAGDFYL